MVIVMPKIKPKYPPYGKILADRQCLNDLPSLVVVNIGGDCWKRAKNWLKHPDFAALVVTPDLNVIALQWPVKNCLCLVEWDRGASINQVVELVKILLESGAVKVVVSPLMIDCSTPSEYWDAEQQRFIKSRDSMMSYYPWAAA